MNSSSLYVAYKPALEAEIMIRVYLIVYHFLGDWGRRQQVVGIIVVANRLFIALRDDNTRHNKYSR